MLFLAVLILAGCGGSTKVESQAVAGHGFHFSAPKGWQVANSASRAAASQDSQLVQVSTFPLVKAYTDALFDKVKKELDARMQALAGQTGGKVVSNDTVTAAGIRAHSYRVDLKGDVLDYTFVLRAKREYELLCRRSASGSDAACKLLLSSFAPA